jgi:hypothetical protein
MVMKRTVRGDGIGDVPGRRIVGRRGVLEETTLGEGEAEREVGGDAYRGVRKRLCCFEGSSLFAAMGLLLVDRASSDDDWTDTPSMISGTPLERLFSLLLLEALRMGRPCFNSPYQTHWSTSTTSTKQ